MQRVQEYRNFTSSFKSNQINAEQCFPFYTEDSPNHLVVWQRMRRHF